eukprot:1143789-Pelagomonas_calceolata.AAC.2
MCEQTGMLTGVLGVSKQARGWSAQCEEEWQTRDPLGCQARCAVPGIQKPVTCACQLLSRTGRQIQVVNRRKGESLEDAF